MVCRELVIPKNMYGAGDTFVVSANLTHQSNLLSAADDEGAVLRWRERDRRSPQLYLVDQESKKGPPGRFLHKSSLEVFERL